LLIFDWEKFPPNTPQLRENENFDGKKRMGSLISSGIVGWFPRKLFTKKACKKFPLFQIKKWGNCQFGKLKILPKFC
jgi:hypothetical protein